MDNEKVMVEQLDKIISNSSELEIVKSVNNKQVTRPVNRSHRGSIGNIFLITLMTVSVLGGLFIGYILAK